MLFGTVITGSEDDETKTETKELIARGKVIRKFTRQEEQRLVGERGNEIKDITAHFFSLIKRYESGEISSFGILPDHVKDGRITRIRLISERQED